MERGPAGEDGIIIEINLKGKKDLDLEEEDGINPNVQVFSLKETKKIIEVSDHESDQEMHRELDEVLQDGQGKEQDQDDKIEDSEQKILENGKEIQNDEKDLENGHKANDLASAEQKMDENKNILLQENGIKPE